MKRTNSCFRRKHLKNLMVICLETRRPRSLMRPKETKAGKQASMEWVWAPVWKLQCSLPRLGSCWSALSVCELCWICGLIAQDPSHPVVPPCFTDSLFQSSYPCLRMDTLIMKCLYLGHLGFWCCKAQRTLVLSWVYVSLLIRFLSL